MLKKPLITGTRMKLAMPMDCMEHLQRSNLQDGYVNWKTASVQ